MSNANIAEQRRGAEIERISKSVASIDRDLARGTNGPNGIPSQHLAEHHAWLMGEKERLEALIAELGSLSPGALVDRYVPEAKPVQAVPLRDALRRGETGPRQAVVHRDTPPTRHTGPPAAPVNPTQAPPGVVYTYDASGNLVAL